MSSARNLGAAIRIGDVTIPGRVWLAPMTGVSDLPFRRAAAGLGAPYVATEMVACEALAAGRPDMVRRAAVGEGLPLMVIQLVGAERAWIAAGARAASRAGAHLVDLNFGCPAKSVAGRQCGAAAMRDPEHARALIEAAVEAATCPVTVKIRLGWDARTQNASAFAAMAERAGARAITVHGRTRSAFYGGTADWRAVAEVKAAVGVPVIVNGDIVDAASAGRALELSGADAVMVGRGAIGAPWLARQIVAGAGAIPRAAALVEIVTAQLLDSLRLYGPVTGVRMFRKHLVAYTEHLLAGVSAERRRRVRALMCRIEAPEELLAAVARLFGAPRWGAA